MRHVFFFSAVPQRKEEKKKREREEEEAKERMRRKREKMSEHEFQEWRMFEKGLERRRLHKSLKNRYGPYCLDKRDRQAWPCSKKLAWDQDAERIQFILRWL